MDWLEEAMDGLEQLIELASHLEATNKYKTNFVPASMMWGAKAEAYKEVANLLCMIARREQPYETEWSWRE